MEIGFQKEKVKWKIGIGLGKKNRILIIFLQLFSSIVFSQEIENDTILLWQLDRPLEWIDFQGKEKIEPNVTHKSDAVTSVKFLFISMSNSEGIIYPYPVCYFLKNISWTISNSTSLLNHEQTHFNISELYARKIRKEFLELLKKENIIQEDYEKISNKYIKEVYERHILYDEETVHGRIQEAQNEWDKKIRKELEELKEFEFGPHKLSE
ncbi:DUF922 domain-containing protein [Neptunitalea lumnitzerae]|nr:DUF922 domain-containing protein [Neptunitalea sp. Y10]